MGVRTDEWLGWLVDSLVLFHRAYDTSIDMLPSLSPTQHKVHNCRGEKYKSQGKIALFIGNGRNGMFSLRYIQFWAAVCLPAPRLRPASQPNKASFEYRQSITGETDSSKEDANLHLQTAGLS
jgi:hypothetical protein